MRSIIITGANRGIGFECAMHMAKIAPNEQIILSHRRIAIIKQTKPNCGREVLI
jgi:NAD(P)-dependent dehydrogenase (short-subunit alcohol dehydrogenase family)